VLAPDVVIVEIVAEAREDTLAVLSNTLAVVFESTVVLLPEATFDVLSERVDVSLVLERFGNDVESEPP